MQAEGKNGITAGRAAPQLGAFQQKITQDFGAGFLGGCVGQCSQLGGGAFRSLEPAGNLADQAAGSFLAPDSEGGLDPGAERMAAKRIEISGRSLAGFDRLLQLRNRGRLGEIQLRCGPLQSFPDHLGGIEGDPEDPLGHLGHFLFLIFRGALAGHGRRGADTQDVVAPEGHAAAANQQGNIGALTAAVSVQLVEYQEAQTFHGTHQFSVFVAGEKQLEHHVIGEQDIRRVAADLLPFGSFFLPGVARKAHRRLAWGVAVFQELFQLLVLAVGQGVHRIDHHPLHAAVGPVSQHMIDHGNDISQTLPRSGSAGQYIGLTFPGFQNRFTLVGVQQQLVAGAIRLRLADTKNTGALRMQDLGLSEIVDRPAGLEGRVELQKRLGPERPGIQFGVHFPGNNRVGDFNETARVTRVILDKPVPKVEYIHKCAPGELIYGWSWTLLCLKLSICFRSLSYPIRNQNP